MPTRENDNVEPESGDRAVVFTDSSSSHAWTLTRALLDAAKDREDFSIVLVVDTGTVDGRAFAKSLITSLAARVFNPGYRKPLPFPPWRLKSLCADRSIPYLLAGDTDTSGLHVWGNILISIYCLKKFSRDVVEAFDYALNYHNGPLPAYRGVLATNWELYRGEHRFGFTFHRLSEGLDEGNVLAAGFVHGDTDRYKFELERRKTDAAIAHWPDVIEKAKRRDKGNRQAGSPTLYTRRMLVAVRSIGDPASITRDDLERRIRCFEWVRITIGGRVLPVSAVRASAGGSRFDFVTADGATLRAVRFKHLPYAVYRIGEILKRLLALAQVRPNRI